MIPAATQVDEFGNAADVAAIAKCSVRLVHKLDKQRLMPAPTRVGKLKRWRLDEIRRWLTARCPDRSTWEAMGGCE